jgi:cathepsin A (carboxypeptidase C)
MIFLDQPTNVGFSYSSDSSTVNNSPVAAKDVYAFLQLFYAKFPELKNREFHIAGESYGGTYAPNIGKVIHEKNKELAQLHSLVWQQDAKTADLTAEAKTNMMELFVIPLTSLILANGLTEPWTQYASVPEYLCNGPYPVLDNNGPECASLRSKVPTCQRLIKSCYDNGGRFSCVPAGKLLFSNRMFLQ